MSDKLKEFLIDLAANDRLMDAYKKDPVKTLRAAGIEQKFIDMILREDQAGLRQALGAPCEVGPNSIIHVNHP